MGRHLLPLICLSVSLHDVFVVVIPKARRRKLYFTLSCNMQTSQNRFDHPNRSRLPFGLVARSIFLTNVVECVRNPKSLRKRLSRSLNFSRLLRSLKDLGRDVATSFHVLQEHVRFKYHGTRGNAKDYLDYFYFLRLCSQF